MIFNKQQLQLMVEVAHYFFILDNSELLIFR